MYSNYKNFIDKYVSFSDDEWLLFTSKLTKSHHKKGEIIHSVGDVCTKLIFINSGIIRGYFIDENGKDYTKKICFNDHHAQMINRYVVDYDSFINKKSSKISFEVLEDCELFSINYHDLQLLYQHSHMCERFARLMAEEAYSYVHNIMVDKLEKTASQRFEEFMEKTPYLLDKVPQYHIATLLGIAPQSLSRLKKLNKK